jgi:hypothetical protein
MTLCRRCKSNALVTFIVVTDGGGINDDDVFGRLW